MFIAETTLYCVLNNTRLEHFIDNTDHIIRLWSFEVWGYSDSIIQSSRWTRDTWGEEDMSLFFQYCYGPDETMLFQIVRHSLHGSRCRWQVSKPRDETGASPAGVFLVEAMRYQQDRVELTITETLGTTVKQGALRWVEAHWKGQHDILALKDVPESPQNWLPMEPPDVVTGEYTRDDVFDWYHRGGMMFVRALKDLAPWLGVAEGTVHNLHSEYMAEYPTGRKPNTDSLFAGMSILPVKEE